MLNSLVEPGRTGHYSWELGHTNYHTYDYTNYHQAASAATVLVQTE